MWWQRTAIPVPRRAGQSFFGGVDVDFPLANYGESQALRPTAAPATLSGAAVDGKSRVRDAAGIFEAVDLGLRHPSDSRTHSHAFYEPVTDATGCARSRSRRAVTMSAPPIATAIESVVKLP